MAKLFGAIFSICLCPILILACKKKNDPKPVDPCSQIINVRWNNPYSSNLEATIEYDEQGRVKHIKGELKNASTYTYYNDRIELAATDIYGTDIGLTYYNRHTCTNLLIFIVNTAWAVPLVMKKTPRAELQFLLARIVSNTSVNR